MKKLSRSELKHIKGGDGSGDPCSMTYQDSSGVWHTEYGSCAVYGTTWATEFSGGLGIGYCKTSSFQKPVALSSNGGVSRCPNS